MVIRDYSVLWCKYPAATHDIFVSMPPERKFFAASTFRNT